MEGRMERAKSKFTLFQNFYSIESYLLTLCLSERRHFLFALKRDIENYVAFFDGRRLSSGLTCDI